MSEISINDLLYLLSCAISNKKPDNESINKMNQSEVYAMAGKQMLKAMVASAITTTFSDSDNKVSENERKQWLDTANIALRTSILTDTERRAVYAFLNQEGIWYMPLKGALIKDLYPKVGMRQMSDTDILFDPSARTKVHDFFMKRGYTCGDFNQSNHDEYRKKPTYSFEMHVSLFMEYDHPELFAYYKDIKERLVRVSPDRCEYRFTPEDAYVYFIVHAMEHHNGGGTGLRSMTDCYVINKHMPDGFDRAKVDQELRKLDAFAFEKNLRECANILFGTCEYGNLEKLNEEQLAFTLDLIDAGVYGNSERYLKNRMKKLSGDNGENENVKRTYLMKRLFPGMLHMKTAFPILNKYPFLVPLCWIIRLLRGRKTAASEMRRVKDLEI